VPVPESQGTFPLGYVTVAFDKEFPPYAAVVLLYQEKLAEKRGLGVRFVPFDIDDKNRISEQRRAELLQSGGFDVLLTTMNAYALWGGPQSGKVTAIVGESAGADRAIVQASAVQTFNDMRGKAFAYSDSSVSEYLLYYMLRVGGIPVNEVTRYGQENLNQATRRYLAREAHGVVGWTSGDLLQAEPRPSRPGATRCRPSTTPGLRPTKWSSSSRTSRPPTWPNGAPPGRRSAPPMTCAMPCGNSPRPLWPTTRR
jgi:hypothetical protein